MFFAEGQIRVHLYGHPCYMRKYWRAPMCRVEGGDRAFHWNDSMLAIHITRDVFHRRQHCEKFVWCSEAPASTCRWRCEHERSELLGRFGHCHAAQCQSCLLLRFTTMASKPQQLVSASTLQATSEILRVQPISAITSCLRGPVTTPPGSWTTGGSNHAGPCSGGRKRNGPAEQPGRGVAAPYALRCSKPSPNPKLVAHFESR